MESQESGGGNQGVHEDVERQGGEGERAAKASPPLSDESNPGETQRPADEQDVGVPPDDEMEREG